MGLSESTKGLGLHRPASGGLVLVSFRSAVRVVWIAVLGALCASVVVLAPPSQPIGAQEPDVLGEVFEFGLDRGVLDVDHRFDQGGANVGANRLWVSEKRTVAFRFEDVCVAAGDVGSVVLTLTAASSGSAPGEWLVGALAADGLPDFVSGLDLNGATRSDVGAVVWDCLLYTSPSPRDS